MCETNLRVVILDNYDSYVYNVYQRIGELTGHESTVFRNDQITRAEVAACEPSHIIITPGPGNPANPEYFGICREILLSLGRRVPILGICLGHQGIGAAFGARIVRARRVMHGMTSEVHHDAQGLFEGVPSPTTSMRYHSLVLDPASLPAVLNVTALTDEGVIMGICHRYFPIYGVQFHPESIGTPDGPRLLRNFLTTTRTGHQENKEVEAATA